jgi:hypothetical protein
MRCIKRLLAATLALVMALGLTACEQSKSNRDLGSSLLDASVPETGPAEDLAGGPSDAGPVAIAETGDGSAGQEAVQDVADLPDPAIGDWDAAFGALGIVVDIRQSFIHGPKPPENQRYIVMHDTEGTGSPASVIDWWDGNGAGVASHFIVGTDGQIWQAAPIDSIAHHAGFGDVGHNAQFGIVEDGRDDRVGTVPIGPAFPDYGMNAWSVGIEMVHVGGAGGYPQAQLDALDALIAAIDAYYGFESAITDHKAWRSGNSDTSAEFAGYLSNYQATRKHG